MCAMLPTTGGTTVAALQTLAFVPATGHLCALCVCVCDSHGAFVCVVSAYAVLSRRSHMTTYSCPIKYK